MTGVVQRGETRLPRGVHVFSAFHRAHCTPSRALHHATMTPWAAVIYLVV